MKKQVFKKISSTLAFLALVAGASSVNANTITLDVNPGSIALANLVSGNTFSLDINVALDAGQQWTGSATKISWLGADVTATSFSNTRGFDVVGTVFTGTGTEIVHSTANIFTGDEFALNFLLTTVNFTYNSGALDLAMFILDPTVTDVEGSTWVHSLGGIDTPVLFDPQVSAVPLPPAFLLLGSALVGLGFTGRRKSVAA